MSKDLGPGGMMEFLFSAMGKVWGIEIKNLSLGVMILARPLYH